MKYIIMCGGIYPQFDKPRQLTEIFGETLVARIIRLLTQAGIDKRDIAISSTSDEFNDFGVEILRHDNKYHYTVNTDWLDAFYPTNDPVCYIFGDVYFSPAAIQTIVDYKVDDVMFFASGPYSFGRGYIKDWSEPFAFKVEKPIEFQLCIELTKQYKEQGKFNRNPIAWELWQVIRNTTLNVIRNNYCQINDYTCDIDEPEDAKRIEDAIQHLELSI